jgi:hypothetical protein
VALHRVGFALRRCELTVLLVAQRLRHTRGALNLTLALLLPLDEDLRTLTLVILDGLDALGRKLHRPVLGVGHLRALARGV